MFFPAALSSNAYLNHPIVSTYLLSCYCYNLSISPSSMQSNHTSHPKKMRILRGLPDQHLHQQFFRVFVHPSMSPYETLRRAGIRLRPGVQLANFLNFVPLALRCRTTIGQRIAPRSNDSILYCVRSLEWANSDRASLQMRMEFKENPTAA